MGLSTKQRKEMGKRGYQLIKEKYSMEIIARQLSNKFERILRE
jgi:glycosyltransferase involved in cell wall biosynthesis